MLKEILEQKKAVIIKQWINLTIKTYPEDTCQFFKKQKNRFDNPVGHTISIGLEALFNGLLNEIDDEIISSFLDPIIRIKAIQPIFTPSQATSFIFLLKKIIRENLHEKLDDNLILNELLLFEIKIDELSLRVFDIYMNCREKIYAIKANQEKDKIYRAFARAGLITELSEEKPELKVF